MKLTRRQLRKLIIEHMEQDYEDNQTKMVRRYLIQLGRGGEFYSMSEKEIDRMAADLRLMSPSEKKHRDLWDLSVPTDIWLKNRNLGQASDDGISRIDDDLVNRLMDIIEEHGSKARFDGRYIIGIAPAIDRDGKAIQDIEKFDASLARKTLIRNVRNWLGY